MVTRSPQTGHADIFLGAKRGTKAKGPQVVVVRGTRDGDRQSGIVDSDIHLSVLKVRRVSMCLVRFLVRRGTVPSHVRCR